MDSKRSVCSHCVMDTSDTAISFDDDGVCNHCRDTDRWFRSMDWSDRACTQRLEHMVARIRAGRTGEYDCLIGLSGGVDSSFLALQAVQLGLRPLAVHFDNGWNSEIAVGNIKTIVDRLGLDLYTYVIDWPEFRDLQRAFIRASVVDIEMLSDHAIVAAMFRIAREQKIRFVLSGANMATESGMPRSWIWRKQDWTNIRAIHKRFGERKLRSYPTLGVWRWLTIYFGLAGFRYVEPLNMMRYRKDEAMETLAREVGWRYYGGKHFESVFTKYYQAHILPSKFGIDKRRAHLSSLIRNGELTRDEALKELDEPLYDPTELSRDTEFVIKKLGFARSEFDELLRQPPLPHDHYPSDQWVYDLLRTGRRLLRPK